jgi:hypothetical protein
MNGGFVMMKVYIVQGAPAAFHINFISSHDQ